MGDQVGWVELISFMVRICLDHATEIERMEIRVTRKRASHFSLVAPVDMMPRAGVAKLPDNTPSYNSAKPRPFLLQGRRGCEAASLSLHPSACVPLFTAGGAAPNRRTILTL